jgi:hypothetical protein
MGSNSEDELARTATAPGSGSSGAPALAQGETLGRYRLERLLGEGGMGTVHAAFDPDLERRVALKLLRTSSGGEEARHRLLREARAMARLTHANVVTVHEVGTAGGRDYVAMELIDGETLADWLRGGRRPPEIVAAFAAAARGLAAAHAAGLVHRDFKPHNVLRRRDGRICVTDFGLARGVDVSAGTPAASEDGVEDIVTATGSLMGTPAYMAPEQWSHGTVGPAADQFAFCVALWEALADERPFRGATIDELKRQVQRGPAALDASKLPRRLRAILRRGLALDPAHRWPSMDALLVAIARAERRPRVVAAFAVGATVLAVVLYVALSREAADRCVVPALEPDRVWNGVRANALARVGQAPGAELIAADFARWGETRARACSAEVEVRPARLACLDGVLAALETSARGLEAARAAAHADVGPLLVDPAVCEGPRPPRLTKMVTPERVVATTAMLESSIVEVPLKTAEVDALLARTAHDPCANAVARIVAAGARRTTVERKRDLDEADGESQRCGDDGLIAQAAYQRALAAVDMREPDLTPKLERADAAASLVNQADVRAAFDDLRATIAQRAGHLDEAIARLEAARDGFSQRGRVRAELRARLRIEELREIRGRPDELAMVGRELTEWRERAVSKLGADDPIVRDISIADGRWRFANGDVVGSHAVLLAAHHEIPLEHAVHASGRVVDEQGAPVAGATVSAGVYLQADEIGVVPDSPDRIAISRADGTFDLREAAPEGIVVAQLGRKRSGTVSVDDGVVLVVSPTARIEGHVDLRGEPATNVTIAVRDPARITSRLTVIGPVRADGTFVLEGVPRGKMIVHAKVSRADTELLAGTPVTIDGEVVRGIQLAVPTSKRSVNVIVRSTVGVPLTRAEVVLMPGKIASSNVAQLQQLIQNVQQRSATRIEGEHAPGDVLREAKPGDVYATVNDVPEGEASACAIGMPTEVADPDLNRKITAHLDKIEVRCVPLGEHDELVVVEVPPWPRLD